MRFSVPSNRVYSRLKATPLVDAVIRTTIAMMGVGEGSEWKETEENCETEGTRDVNLKRFVKPWYRLLRRRNSLLSSSTIFVILLSEIYLGKKIGLTVFQHPSVIDLIDFRHFYLSNLFIRVLNNSGNSIVRQTVQLIENYIVRIV